MKRNRLKPGACGGTQGICVALGACHPGKILYTPQADISPFSVQLTITVGD